MAQVSNTPLPSQTREHIEQQLKNIFREIRGDKVLFDLLTETEALMFAKRLAAILMLVDEQSYYRIKQILGVSISTSRRLHQLLIGGSYEHLETYLANKKHRKELENRIMLLLQAGLPPRTYVIKKRNSR